MLAIVCILVLCIMFKMTVQRLSKPNDLLKVLQEKEEQFKFKTIFDNLEEPLLLLTKQEIEYVNDKYL